MSRRQATIIKCDGNGCKKIVEVETLDTAPEGWHRVQPSKNGRYDTNSSFDLCSLDCVRRWATGRKQAEIAATPAHLRMDEKDHLLERADDEDEVKLFSGHTIKLSESDAVPSHPSNNGNAKSKTVKEEIYDLFDSDPNAELLGRDIVDLLNHRDHTDVYRKLKRLIDENKVIVAGGTKGSTTNPQRYKLKV
jgi:hypothetical protein